MVAQTKCNGGGSPFIGAANRGGTGRLEHVAARTGNDLHTRSTNACSRVQRGRGGNVRDVMATRSKSFCRLLLSVSR
jgi:hypothetical protein